MVIPGLTLPVLNYVVNVGHKLLQLLKPVMNLKAKNSENTWLAFFKIPTRRGRTPGASVACPQHLVS